MRPSRCTYVGNLESDWETQPRRCKHIASRRNFLSTLVASCHSSSVYSNSLETKEAFSFQLICVGGFRAAQFGNDFETERRNAAAGFSSVYNAADASFFSTMRVINDMSFWPFTFVDFP